MHHFNSKKGDRIRYLGEDTPTYKKGDKGIIVQDYSNTEIVYCKFTDSVEIIHSKYLEII